jgi:hypothetical protein
MLVAWFFGVGRTRRPRLWRISSLRIGSGLVFRRCVNPYREIAGSQNADGAVAQRVVLVRVGDFAGADADTTREVTADLLAAADASYIPERAPPTKWMSCSRRSMPSLAKMR